MDGVLLHSIARTGVLGFLIGGALGALGHTNRNQQNERLKYLKTDVAALKLDQCFLNAVLDLYPYSKINKPRSTELFDTIVNESNNIVECYMLANSPETLNRGVLKFKANRLLSKVTKALNTLCELHGLKGGVNNMVKDELTDSVQQITKCADNYIHNMVLQ